MLTGKVLITGGAGFLGRGILRQAKAENWDCEFTVYSRDETKQDICRRRYPYVRYVLGDIRDKGRLETVLVGHDVVIHAGAIKYVPEAEYNVEECIAVNVEGTRNVLHASRDAGVKQVCVISTDKAVKPINTYGMTKALAERLVGEAARWGDMQVVGARYGNVVGSTGSVIPLFYQQREGLGRVRVTDPTMTRFWMSLPQAVDTILRALTSSVNGAIVVPRPHAMSMEALAKTICDKVEVIGPRPGEKQHEELISVQESIRVLTRSNHYLLLPPTSEIRGDHEDPFTVASHSVPQLDSSTMLAMIADAENV